MFSLFFWVVNFVTMCFSHGFIVLLLLSSILSSRGFTPLSIFFSHGLTSSSSCQFYFSHGFSVFLASNFDFLLVWLSSCCQFCSLMMLGVLVLSIFFSHGIGCIILVKFCFSLWKLWKHWGSSAFNLFPHWFCMLCATDQYLYVVDFLIKIPGHWRSLTYYSAEFASAREWQQLQRGKMKRNEIDANQIHEIYEMADKSPQLQCRQISELLNACIALLPLQFSTQYSLPALLLSSHLHSPHSVPLSSPTPSQTVAIRYNHLTCNKLCFQRSWTELGKTLSLTSSQQQAPLMMVHDPTRP